MNCFRIAMLLMLLLPLWGAVGAETLRVALLAEEPRARNAADLALAGLSGEFEFVERNEIDRVIAEQKLQRGGKFEAEALARASALARADLCCMISAGKDGGPPVLTVFDSSTGIRMIRKGLPEDVAAMSPAIRTALLAGAAKYRRRESCNLLALVVFRNATFDSQREIETLERELNDRLHDIDNLMVVEREYLDYLLQEQSLSLNVANVAASAALLSVECLPDPDPRQYKTTVMLATGDGESICRRDFTGGERNRADLISAAIAGALAKPLADSSAAATEAQAFFREFLYAHKSREFELARKKIYAAIALNQKSILYRSWAMEYWLCTRREHTPEQTFQALDALLENTDSDYLRRRAEGIRNEVAGRSQSREVTPHAKLPLPELAGELDYRVIDKWSEARTLLGARRRQGKLFLLMTNIRYEFLIYSVEEKKMVIKSKRTGALPHPSNSVIEMAGDIAVVAFERRMLVADLASRAVHEITDVPCERVAALAVNGERIYLFGSNRWLEILLFSCRLDGTDRRIEINPRRLTSGNFFEGGNRIFGAPVAVADPVEDALYFGLLSESYSKKGFSGFYRFEHASGKSELIQSLVEPELTRSFIDGFSQFNCVLRDGDTVYWSSWANGLEKDQFRYFGLFMTFNRATRKFSTVAKGGDFASAKVLQCDRVLKTPDLFGPFTISGDRLVISDERGVLAVCGKDGETCFNAPAMKALFAVAGTDRVIGVTERSVLEFEIGKSSSIVSERSQK